MDNASQTIVMSNDLQHDQCRASAVRHGADCSAGRAQYASRMMRITGAWVRRLVSDGTGSAQNQQQPGIRAGQLLPEERLSGGVRRTGLETMTACGWNRGDDEAQDGEQESGYDPYYDAYDNPAGLQDRG